MSKEILEKIDEEKEIRGIKIGENWILYNDQLNLVIEQYGIKINKREKDITKREGYGLINRTFHRTLEQAFNYIINKTMCMVDFKDLNKVNEEVLKLKNAIIEFKRCTQINGDTLSVIDRK